MQHILPDECRAFTEALPSQELRRKRLPAREGPRLNLSLSAAAREGRLGHRVGQIYLSQRFARMLPSFEMCNGTDQGNVRQQVAEKR
eukprot:6181977-Pleurochrysis_carterae.AAC.2